MRVRLWAISALCGLLLVLPFFVAQAQSEDGANEPTPPETVTEIVADVIDVVTESNPESSQTEEITENTETTATTTGSDESKNTTNQSASSDAGSVVTEAGTSTPDTSSPLSLDIASSTEPTATSTLSVTSSTDPTASSTNLIVQEPIAEQPPKETPLVLQPSVKMDSTYKVGSSIKAQIRLKNQTCRQCDRSTASTTVIAYYTTVYPNDGPESVETGERVGLQTYEVDSILPWESTRLTWKGTAAAAGKYYFVVVVDSEKTAGISTMFRSEFTIE